MTSDTTCTSLAGKGVFALLLVSVMLSGLPMVEVHSHENATHGHSHDGHDFIEDHAADETDTEDGDTDTASFHAHDVSATSLGVVASFSIDSTVSRHSHSYIPPPDRWLPDNVIVPFYRPPIA